MSFNTLNQDSPPTENSNVRPLTPHEQELTKEQLKHMANCESTCVEPIPWDEILSKAAFQPLTPVSIRQWFMSVVQKMNVYFAIHLSGPHIFQIQVSRKALKQDRLDIINLSTWRARQIFNRKVSVQWLESNKKKSFHMNVVDFWLKASNRKEIYARPSQALPPVVSREQTNPVAVWLSQELQWNVNNVVKFDSHFNIREDLYKSFLSTVSDPEMWSSKLICEQIYKILPECKPPPGKRPRFKQRAIMYIPTRERVLNALNALNGSNYNTGSVRF